MNKKIYSYKERVQRMLAMIEKQESLEGLYDDYNGYIQEKEEEMIDDFHVELAALNQLAFQYKSRNSAKPVNTIVIDEKGAATYIHY